MENIGLDDVEHARELLSDQRWPIRVFEYIADPVVHELDDRETILHAPGDVPVGQRRVVLGGEEGDMVASPIQLATELEGIDLGSRPMSRQKIMDSLQHPKTGHIS